jgi:predicted ATPase/class 3 adenylate cyclase
VQQPTSVATFLFTDIEGSTRLWECQPDRMQAALARHDALAREAVENMRGRVVKTTGDGIYAAFDDPLDAVRAALCLQQSLTDPAATAGVSLAGRCGLHTGIVEGRDHDFFGNAVNRAARIMTAAHGGQILVSHTAADLIRDRLPDDIALRDLGLVRLRDLAHPERVYQVVHAALRETFPPLRSLEATPNNLPQQVTSFVGRKEESIELTQLIARSRLVTVVGTGGLGKTRLSLQVAAGIIDEYSDGVWLVELAATADPRLVPQAVASVLGVTETAGPSAAKALLAHVRERHLLLILDNCEHLASACAMLVHQLLQASTTLKILASSREPLNVSGETTYSLPALALPDDPQVVTPAALLQSEAARLFVERAVAVHPPFAVTAANAPAVAMICRRLDGIPLALELAAARMRALSVDVIAARLDDRFRLLVGGDRSGLPRQRTLRAMIDWSHELLTDAEATLFRRLAVFAGGFTLDAAEAVGRDEGQDVLDVLDTLTHLVEKSLVERDAEGDRYRLLETVRQYALERLDAAGEAHRQRTRHLLFYLALAHRAGPELIGPHQSEWLKRLDTERENLLNAHQWQAIARSPELAEAEQNEPARRQHGRNAHDIEIAGVLNALAQMARAGGDLATAEPLYAGLLEIARRSDDADIVAVSLLNLAMVATVRKAHASAREMLVEVLQFVDESGLRPAAQSLLEVSAGLAASSEEWNQAVRLYGAAEAITVATEFARDPADEAFLAPLIATAREHLGADAFASAVAAGRALDYDAAIAELRVWLERANARLNS